LSSTCSCTVSGGVFSKTSGHLSDFGEVPNLRRSSSARAVEGTVQRCLSDPPSQDTSEPPSARAVEGHRPTLVLVPLQHLPENIQVLGLLGLGHQRRRRRLLLHPRLLPRRDDREFDIFVQVLAVRRRHGRRLGRGVHAQLLHALPDLLLEPRVPQKAAIDEVHKVHRREEEAQDLRGHGRV